MTRAFPLTLSLIAGIAPLAHAATTYRVTDLGDLGQAAQFATPSSAATGINASGQITGYASTTTGSRTILWSPTSPNAATGTLKAIPISGSGNWQAAGINDFGQIVGNDPTHAYLWTPAQPNGPVGTVTPLPTVSAVTRTIVATAVNNAGQVTGYSGVGLGNQQHTVLWNPDAPRGTTLTGYDLGDLPGGFDESAGYAINSSGQIAGYVYITTPAGYYAPRASLWTPDSPNSTTGSFQALDPLTPVLNSDISYAYALTDDARLAGQSYVGLNAAARGHAAAWLGPGTSPTDLGGPIQSTARGINSRGQIVGSATFPAGPHAFLWSPADGLLDLNTLLDPATETGWTLSSAVGINDAGQIAGTGTTPAGRTHAFLLTPTPEPTTLAALAAASPLLTCRRPRRCH